VDGSGEIKGFSVEADKAKESNVLYPALDQCILSCAAINEIFSLGLDAKLSGFLSSIEKLRGFR
jgi:hypothetical protein